MIHDLYDASTFQTPQSLLVQLKTFYLIKLCEYFRTQAVWIYRRCNIYLDCQSVVAFSPRSRTHFRLYCHSSQPCQHCTSICVLSSLSKLYDIIWLILIIHIDISNEEIVENIPVVWKKSIKSLLREKKVFHCLWLHILLLDASHFQSVLEIIDGGLCSTLNVYWQWWWWWWWVPN